MGMLESSNEGITEKIWTKNRTFAGDVWYRFHRKPTAIAGFIIILFLLFFAIAGPMFTKIQLFHPESGGSEYSSLYEGV